MSIQVVGWALEYQDLPLDKRTKEPDSGCAFVLVSLANHADRGGCNSFPSVDTIRTETKLSERAIQYKLRALEEHGVIAKTANPLIESVTIKDPRKRPTSYDIVAYVSEVDRSSRGAKFGVQSRPWGAKSEPDSPDQGCKVGGDFAPEPSLNRKSTSSGAKAPDSDACASCPGQADATTDDGATEVGQRVGDLFASWPGLDQEQRESQDPRALRPENGSSTNGDSRGSGVKVKRIRRSSSRAPLPPDQAAAVAAGVAGWVDDYRDGHGGTEPTEHKRGQAAREIRALIVAGNPPDRVLHAARSAGRAGYATVEQQLARMTSTNGGSRPGRISATELPRDDWRRFVQE